MDRPEYHADSIVISPEAEQGGYLYRQAVAYAKAGHYEQALASAEAITKHNFSLNRYFKSEALAIIVRYSVEADNLVLAESIAENIEIAQHRDVAFRGIAFGYIQRGDFEVATGLTTKIDSSDIKEAILSGARTKRETNES